MNEQPPTETAIAIARQPRDIKDLIKSADFANAVKAGLPKHLTVERFMRVALNATMRQPDLLKCSKESFFLRMLELSALGIEPDGRRAHLIPFQNNKVCAVCSHQKEQHQGQYCRVPGCQSKNCGDKPSAMEVQLIIDYKGLSELIRRSGDVSYMHADAIYESDNFEFVYGTGAKLVHKFDLLAADRGKIIGFYSFVRLRDGNEDFMVMSKSDVDKIRDRSKAKTSGPWVTDYGEMGKKTVFRRHSKWLPLSPESRDAVEADDDLDIEGAFTVSGDSVKSIGSETIDEHSERLNIQMAEQAAQAEKESAEAAKKESPEPATGAAQQPRQEAPAESSPGPTPVAKDNGRWRDHNEMITAFTSLFRTLGEESSFRILGANGISSVDDLSVSDPATGAAFDAMKQAAAGLSQPQAQQATAIATAAESQTQTAPVEKPVFGSPRNRR